MTVQEFYESTGGDYKDALARFRDEARIKRFLLMFTRDPSFSELEEAMGREDWEAAFRAAHTLKGVTANLSMTGFYNSVFALTEALRAKTALSAEQMKLYESVTEQYRKIMRELTTLSV